MANKKHIGSSFDDFLEEEGIKADVELRAMKKIIADNLSSRMEHQHIGVTALAEKMHTSRTLVNRLLDPEDTGFAFKTLGKACAALETPLEAVLRTKRAK